MGCLYLQDWAAGICKIGLLLSARVCYGKWLGRVGVTECEHYVSADDLSFSAAHHCRRCVGIGSVCVSHV